MLCGVKLDRFTPTTRQPRSCCERPPQHTPTLRTMDGLDGHYRRCHPDKAGPAPAGGRRRRCSRRRRWWAPLRRRRRPGADPERARSSISAVPRSACARQWSRVELSGDNYSAPGAAPGAERRAVFIFGGCSRPRHAEQIRSAAGRGPPRGRAVACDGGKLTSRALCRGGGARAVRRIRDAVMVVRRLWRTIRRYRTGGGGRRAEADLLHALDLSTLSATRT